jgi:hypothetical protein
MLDEVPPQKPVSPILIEILKEGFNTRLNLIKNQASNIKHSRQ